MTVGVADEPLARTVHSEETLSPPRQTLSLYITPLMMDFAQADYEMPASMMAAVRYHDNRVGGRGVRAGWVWQFWQHDWVFRQENEVWGKQQLVLFLVSSLFVIQNVLFHLCLNCCKIQGSRKRIHSLYASRFTLLRAPLYPNSPRLHMYHEIYWMVLKLHSTIPVSHGVSISSSTIAEGF
jgi:hypothetical protein